MSTFSRKLELYLQYTQQYSYCLPPTPTVNTVKYYSSRTPQRNLVWRLAAHKTTSTYNLRHTVHASCYLVLGTHLNLSINGIRSISTHYRRYVVCNRSACPRKRKVERNGAAMCLEPKIATRPRCDRRKEGKPRGIRMSVRSRCRSSGCIAVDVIRSGPFAARALAGLRRVLVCAASMQSCSRAGAWTPSARSAWHPWPEPSAEWSPACLRRA